MSQRAYPGVSLSMSLSFVKGCEPGSVVDVRSRVVRLGKRVVHTQMELHNDKGELMVQASHLKFCDPPASFLPLLWMRLSVAKVVVPWVIKFDPPTSQLPPAAEVEWKKFSDPEKRYYYQRLGKPGLELLGFDRALVPAQLERKAGEDGSFTVVKTGLASNNYKAMHGACQVSLVPTHIHRQRER